MDDGTNRNKDLFNVSDQVEILENKGAYFNDISDT